MTRRATGLNHWLLLGPYVAGLLLLVLVPAGATLAMAAFQFDLVSPPLFVGLDNLRALLADDVFRIAVRNSLLIVILAVPLRILLVTGLALVLHPRNLRGGGLARSAVFLPVVVPEIAFSIGWLWLLNPGFGPINAGLGALGIDPVPWQTDPLAAQAGILLVTLFLVGEAFVVLVAARRSIPRDLYETAFVEGATPLATTRRVTLPAMSSVIAILALRDTVLVSQATFVPSLVITGGGPPPYATTYVPLFVFERSFEYLRYGYGAAATTFFLAVAAAVVVLQLRVLQRWAAA